jgi:hypothetical protein
VFIQRVFVFALVPVGRIKILVRRAKTWKTENLDLTLPFAGAGSQPLPGAPPPSTARPCPPEWPGKTDPMDGRAPSPPAHPPAAGPRLRARRTGHGHGLDLDPVRVPEVAVGIGHIQKSPGTLRTPGKYAPWPDSGRVPPLSLRLSGRAAPFRKPASWAAGFLQSADSPHFLCLNLISLGLPEAFRTVRFQMRLRVR